MLECNLKTFHSFMNYMAGWLKKKLFKNWLLFVIIRFVTFTSSVLLINLLIGLFTCQRDWNIWIWFCLMKNNRSPVVFVMFCKILKTIGGHFFRKGVSWKRKFIHLLYHANIVPNLQWARVLTTVRLSQSKRKPVPCTRSTWFIK